MTHTLIPKEPTEAMLREGAAQIRNFMDETCPYPRVRAMWKAMLSAAPEPDAVVLHFHHATTPPVKPGSMQSFIVLTEHDGRKTSCAAHYLNQYPLEYENGCEAPECAEGKHEDGCPTTGWFYDESNFEYDHCYYRLKGTVLAWAPIPKPDEIFAEKASDDAVKALVEAALRVAKSGGNTSDHMTACEKTMGATHPCTCGATALRSALRPFLKEGE